LRQWDRFLFAYTFPSAASSRNKILAITLAFDPPSVVVLLPRNVLTVTNPWRDVLYEPLTVRVRKSIVNSFQMAKSLSMLGNLIETAPGVHPARARRTALNIALAADYSPSTRRRSARRRLAF
jgi:hypothetical protein